MFKLLGNNKGMAILIAISVVSVLIAAGLELNRKVRTTTEAAATTRDRMILSQMAISGVEAAKLMLINDINDSQADSLQEDWASEEKLSELLELVGFEDGKVAIKISDEMGKIQINALVNFPEGRQFNESQRQMWVRFSEKLLALYEDIEDTDTNTIINSIKDWLDSGDDDAITGLSGAESDYYQDLDPPYEAMNGPFNHLGEVALVKGILPEIFYGPAGAAGLSSFITVHGATEQGDEKFTFEGKININTADLPVLAALLPPESDDFAQALIDYREEVSEDNYKNDLTNIGWYKNVPGFSDIELDTDLISVSSSIFRVESNASLNGINHSIVAVLQRQKNEKTGKWECKTLNWQAD